MAALAAAVQEAQRVAARVAQRPARLGELMRGECLSDPHGLDLLKCRAALAPASAPRFIGPYVGRQYSVCRAFNRK